ncbi:P-loop domain-containing protein [Butyrivibrio sp. INlla14]|uniref:P-loop domain-containing protein n=1 Tax=Butyrivibrio sp. INlla14 TaxID=1520808 RepID=UPI0008770794|nr:P-loop domain-containing protein [Butyrivibrio sp. INlla14]SCY55971.1 Predicted ATPase of the ABC class [Butyrivibrio sp. INlla14]
MNKTEKAVRYDVKGRKYIGTPAKYYYSDMGLRNASGSVSQAANIVEAIGCGVKLILIDEDKSATNFMIRDKVMRKIVPDEPIIPFTDRIEELNKKVDKIIGR